MTIDVDLAEQREAWDAGGPRWCLNCHDDGPLRPWPLPDEWGDTNVPVCDRCWLKQVRGKVTAQWDGRQLRVSSAHPVHGELFRGTIRAAGIEARGHQPAVRWQITDNDAYDLGEVVGDYVDAQARLLDATAWADQIETNEEG